MVRNRKTASERGVLPRVVKFEVFPDKDQVASLIKVSEHLALLWNLAHQARTEAFQEYIAPLYEEFKVARAAENKDAVKSIKERKKEAFARHYPTGYDQINALFFLRKIPEFADVMRNWQEQTLLILEGGFQSFFKARNNGDWDAQPPGPRREGHFHEIYGRLGFAVQDGFGVTEWNGSSGKRWGGQEKQIVLRPGAIDGEVSLVFPVPAYQSMILTGGEKLGRFKEKQFTLYRTPRNLKLPGRFWISIAFEYAEPEALPERPDNTVYLALGASSIGVLSARDERVIKLWRPDVYWMPRIKKIEQEMKPIKRPAEQKPSRRWLALNKVRSWMYHKMANQQKLNRREVVQNLLNFGVHFVVTEYVIRSKPGKLADSSKPERGGTGGLNWSAQNTGAIGELVAQLELKAKERGGSVRKHKLVLREMHPSCKGRANKIWMARKLRESFLEFLKIGTVSVE